MLVIKGRGIVEGSCRAKILLIDSYVSFLGDVNPNNGMLFNKYYIGGKILAIRGSRGSTVGSYILYSLSKKGHAPLGMVSSSRDPVLITGCVISNIPLMIVNEESFNRLREHIHGREDIIGFLDTVKGVLVVD